MQESVHTVTFIEMYTPASLPCPQGVLLYDNSKRSKTSGPTGRVLCLAPIPKMQKLHFALLLPSPLPQLLHSFSCSFRNLHWELSLDETLCLVLGTQGGMGTLWLLLSRSSQLGVGDRHIRSSSHGEMGREWMEALASGVPFFCF